VRLGYTIVKGNFEKIKFWEIYFLNNVWVYVADKKGFLSLVEEKLFFVPQQKRVCTQYANPFYML
jgi:hypothetical protein